MRNPSPPKNSLAVSKITSSTLKSSTWGFFIGETLIAISKLLERSTVTLRWRLIVNLNLISLFAFKFGQII